MTPSGKKAFDTVRLSCCPRDNLDLLLLVEKLPLMTPEAPLSAIMSESTNSSVCGSYANGVRTPCRTSTSMREMGCGGFCEWVLVSLLEDDDMMVVDTGSIRVDCEQVE